MTMDELIFSCHETKENDTLWQPTLVTEGMLRQAEIDIETITIHFIMTDDKNNFENVHVAKSKKQKPFFKFNRNNYYRLLKKSSPRTALVYALAHCYGSDPLKLAEKMFLSEVDVKDSLDTIDGLGISIETPRKPLSKNAIKRRNKKRK